MGARRLRAGAIGIGLGLLAACQAGPSQPMRVLEATDSGISILADFNSPALRRAAVRHCEKYGKSPAIRTASPAGETVLSGWATGTKPYVFEYDCR